MNSLRALALLVSLLVLALSGCRTVQPGPAHITPVPPPEKPLPDDRKPIEPPAEKLPTKPEGTDTLDHKAPDKPIWKP